MAEKFPSMCEAYCKSCGYDLQGSVEAVCPECGQAFDPYDVKTFTLKQYRDEPLFGQGQAAAPFFLFVCELVVIAYPLFLMGLGKLSYVQNAMYYGSWRTPYEYVADSLFVRVPAAITFIMAILALPAIIFSAIVFFCSVRLRLSNQNALARSSLITVFMFLTWVLLVVDIFYRRLFWIDTLWILD